MMPQICETYPLLYIVPQVGQVPLFQTLFCILVYYSTVNILCSSVETVVKYSVPLQDLYHTGVYQLLGIVQIAIIIQRSMNSVYMDLQITELVKMKSCTETDFASFAMDYKACLKVQITIVQQNTVQWCSPPLLCCFFQPTT